MSSLHACLIAALVLVACGKPAVEYGAPSDYVTPGGGDAGTPPQGGGTHEGLPCDVTQLLQAHCDSCHSNPPVGGAPMALVTYADLTAPSRSNPSKSNAQVSVERMQSASAPMPPGQHLAASEISLLATWVSQGAPSGTCVTEAPDAGSVTGVDTAPQCTSGTYWSGGGGSSRMHPGRACIACHADSNEAPVFRVAGTLYPTAHEADDCNGTSAGTIEITDATGQTVSLTPNAAGNFSSNTSFSFPIRASVTRNGVTRTMVTPQMSGDCNSCHSQSGTSGAPGRIMVP